MNQSTENNIHFKNNFYFTNLEESSFIVFEFFFLIIC
jgi:hypothetical protein